MMTIWYEDKKTGISAGINDAGELFFGDDFSGVTLPDTPENRAKIRREIEADKEDAQKVEEMIARACAPAAGGGTTKGGVVSD